MAVGDEFFEVLTFDTLDPGDADSQFLARITVEDPANFHVTVDSGGALKFTPKPKPVARASTQVQPKYELIAEGDLFRVRALREIVRHGVVVGQLGGLVADENTLSQRGDAWIAETCTARGNSLVSNDALVAHSSVLDGYCHVSGAARVHSSTLTGGIFPTEQVWMQGCTMTTRNSGEISLSGSVIFDDTVISANDRRLHFAAGNVKGGRIHGQHELLSVFHPTWGWLSAYPGGHGQLQFKIGCQVRDSFDGLRDLASEYRVSAEEAALLQAFLQMVQVAQGFWTSPSKSAEVVQSAAAPGPAADAVSIIETFGLDH